MPVTFPIPLGDFWSALEVSAISCVLSSAVEMSETGSGEILTARNGTRLWGGSVVLVPEQHADADAVVALVELLQDAGGTFLANDPVRRFPIADPAGAAIGAQTFSLTTIASNRREITIAASGGGVTLSRGDHLSFVYGSRYYYGRVITGAAAAASVTVEVVPHVPEDATTGGAVHLSDPRMTALIVPNTHNFDRRPALTDPIGFEWRQVI